MFKVAPRYLSGVSVFYGDDITQRDTTGEIVVVVGQATKGPASPIQLKSIDNAISLYGIDNPLVKALYQFNDGYTDSPKLQNIVYVTMRIGGIKTAIATSYGLVMESSDAYTGLEDDYFIYVDDSSATSAKVKIWDSNKLLVYNSEEEINTGHWVISSLPTGTSTKIYGVDVDNDPLETPVTVAQLVKQDIIYKGATWLTAPASGILADSANVTVTDDVSLYPLSGTLVITEVVGALTYQEFLPYTLDKATGKFTFVGVTNVYDYTSAATIGIIGTTITEGDSELDLTNRELYEKTRNALLDIEMYTPDYIVPGGIAFDATGTYTKNYVETTTLINDVTAFATTITVDAAAEWPSTGSVTLYDGVNTVTLSYTAITASGTDYVLTIDGQTGQAFAANATLVTNTYSQVEDFELGIGYIKETDMGDHFEFAWSNTKLAGYYIAHFGYLFAKFCNDAAVGYNTPLFGMNVNIPFSSTPTRAEIVDWIGSFPEYKIIAGNTEAIESVVKNGTGLLGNSVLAGSKAYNRCYLSDPSANDFADPAYGLLLTDQGFIDGSEIKDDFNKLVDLGKFGCVGAGLLTFSNASTSVSYIDSMGIYALGMIAGLPKNEGASFRKIGTGSNVGVGVIVSRSLYNDLAKLGYIVPTREKGLGWVVNNDTAVSRDQSAYYLLSTTRTVKYVVEDKRSILVGFIGKPVNTYYYEAAKTKLAESFTADISNGMLNGFKFNLEVVSTTSRIMGKFLLNCSLNPPLELVQVDINSVIDRNVTNTTATASS